MTDWFIVDGDGKQGELRASCTIECPAVFGSCCIGWKGVPGTVMEDVQADFLSGGIVIAG